VTNTKNKKPEKSPKIKKGHVMSKPETQTIDNIGKDHLESITKNISPITAIEELIWNALDADADQVNISLEQNELDALVKIIVHDNGTGIAVKDWRKIFGSLGDSPKRNLKTTPIKKRDYHGKEGKGRLKAFRLGNKVTWQTRVKTRVQTNSQIIQYDLVVFLDTINKIERQNEIDISLLSTETGTDVIIEQIRANHPELINQKSAIEQIERHFSPYLQKYPGIKIFYNNKLIDTNSKISKKKTINFTFSVNDVKTDVELLINEWLPVAKVERKLHFCDENGFTIEEIALKIRSYGIIYTAYLKSSLFREKDDNSIMFSMDSTLSPLIKETKKRMQKYFKERVDVIQNEIIASWQHAKIYPYEKIESNPIKIIQKQVFDQCALTIHKKLPYFQRSLPKEKEFIFRLLKFALEEKPESVIEVIKKVLDLSPVDLENFASLLYETELSAMVKTVSLVIDRINFIESLEPLLYSDYKKALLETQQLQKILTQNLWIFGEEYQLGVSDQRLTTLLKIHLQLLERNDFATVTTNTDETLPNERIDLMLYQRVSHPQKSEHLVIELKRPSATIGSKEIGQIKDYAFNIVTDSRFNTQNVHWTFILLANELDERAKTECQSKDREFGHIHIGNNFDIFVKTWSDIIEDAKWRYNLFYENLKTKISNDNTKKYLEQKHKKNLPSKKTK
jgi:hypothetical protein